MPKTLFLLLALLAAVAYAASTEYAMANGFVNATATSAKQYLVAVYSIFGVKEYWVNASSSFSIPLENVTINGIEFIPYAVIVNDMRTNGTVVVDKPMNITVAYMASADVAFGAPQLFAQAVLQCGSSAATSKGIFVWASSCGALRSDDHRVRALCGEVGLIGS
nr:MAG: hypothetical protein TU35_09605 [Thermoproteus sp. AZ2]